MHVLNKIAKLAAATVVTRGEQDLALWKVWKKDPSDTNASALLKQVQPLIMREAGKWSGTLAKPLLEVEGKRLAMDAFHTYDPKMGAALGTHTVNSLMRMSRLAYSNQNVARLPENKHLLYHTYHTGHEALKDELGRAPTVDELADRLGWSVNHLTDFRKSIGRAEMLESGGTSESEGGLYESDGQDNIVDFIHHDLPPPQKLLFEHITGYGGAEILSNQELQKKMKLTQGQFSYLKAKVISHVEDVMSKRK